MKDELKISIIKRIIETNSLHSEVAKYALDENRGEEFILNCYDQAHIGSFQRFLGKELFDDLIRYNHKYNNKEIITFTK